MPKMGRTENLNTDPGSKFRGASFLLFAKTSLLFKNVSFSKISFLFLQNIIFQKSLNIYIYIYIYILQPHVFSQKSNVPSYN